jgi:hypothetical protein
VGGYNDYSLSTLEYSAFDPIFYLHHSNVDRLWAIWQHLQMKRGLPYKVSGGNKLKEVFLLNLLNLRSNRWFPPGTPVSSTIKIEKILISLII